MNRSEIIRKLNDRFIKNANHSWKIKFPDLVGKRGNVLNKSKNKVKQCWQYILDTNNSSFEIIYYRDKIKFDINANPIHHGYKIDYGYIDYNSYYELTVLKCRNPRCGHSQVYWHASPLEFNRDTILCSYCLELEHLQKQLNQCEKNISIIEYIHNNNYSESKYICQCGQSWVKNKKLVIVCPICNPTGASTNDVMYMWRFDQSDDYKIGMTSRRRKDQRIYDVAKRWAVHPTEITIVNVKCATEIENKIRKQYKDCRPYLDYNKDGKTEIYRLSENEAKAIKRLILASKE
ncbi:hypothetical protein [Endozoicomonas sp. ALC066]|uniref:hypothetical protein n=1 Tax=Endozoicomonas sp. ALC066 TaxID=3403078 RepID=UPI003BB73C0E